MTILNKNRTAATLLACALLPWASSAPTANAQQPTVAQQSAIRAACRSDFMAQCEGVPAGGAAALNCLKQNIAKVSPACQQALAPLLVAKGAAPAGSQAAAPIATPPSKEATRAGTPQGAALASVSTWPFTYRGDAGVATVYQPQVISWPERRTLNTRIAIGVTPEGAKAPVLGTIEVAFATQTDLDTRTVTLTQPKLTSTRFPALATAQAERVEAKVKDALAAMGIKRVPLDTVLLSLQQETATPATAAVNNEPPRIFVSTRPASLVVFDGKPVLAPIANSTLSVAVNTNWDVFNDSASNTWYLLNNGAWMAAPDAQGPWMPAGKLPAAFAALSKDANKDANFAKVAQQIPGRAMSPKDAPTVFVSITPATIIAINGAPQFAAIPGTSLQYVANTDAALFKDTSTSRYYYLVSGRWFAATALEGPWTFATATLPPDFARIPAGSPRGFVLVSVPGTAAAQQALIEAQIPQQGTLDRATAKIDVAFAGEPKFEPIVGTTMLYAANTSFAVIKVGDVYFAAWQGAWFTAPTPNGPWVLAASVPQVIYTIPPASPLYPVTYLTVVASSPTAVTYSYTSGYSLSYVSAGWSSTARATTTRRITTRPPIQFITPIRTPTAVRRTTTPQPVRGRTAARSTVRTVALPRAAPTTTPRPARMRKVAPSTGPTAALAPSPLTTPAPVAMRMAARRGDRTAGRAMQAGTTPTRAAPARRSRTAMRTAAGDRVRFQARTRPCTRKARATRRARRGRSIQAVAPKVPACPARAAIALAWSKAPGATSTPGPTATSTRRPTAAGKSTTTVRGIPYTPRRAQSRETCPAPRKAAHHARRTTTPRASRTFPGRPKAQLRVPRTTTRPGSKTFPAQRNAVDSRVPISLSKITRRAPLAPNASSNSAPPALAAQVADLPDARAGSGVKTQNGRPAQ